MASDDCLTKWYKVKLTDIIHIIIYRTGDHPEVANPRKRSPEVVTGSLKKGKRDCREGSSWGLFGRENWEARNRKETEGRGEKMESSHDVGALEAVTPHQQEKNR